MLGAVAGDILGSYYEFNPTKEYNFELLRADACPTDDTVMTLAVAEWLVEDSEYTHEALTQYMRKWGRKFPNAGYGGMFRRWLADENATAYGSFGNGAAMRVSPVGLYASSLDEALCLAKISAEVTHNHPEAINAAQAVAAAIWMAKNSHSKEEIRSYIEENLTKEITLEELSELVYFNKTYFVKRFKILWGTTPMRFVTKTRIEAARKLLSASSHSISEIAELCGFKSIHYFSRTFKKETGISPLDYRRRLADK